MAQLEQVLSTADPSTDSVDGHPIAYTHLMQAAQSFKHPPIFLKEDSKLVIKSENADKVPVWMNIAAQVATGNRRRVLEDGPDKMNSDDDDALEEEHGDKLTGMYTPEMDPKKGPVNLTEQEAARQRAASQGIARDGPIGSECVWSQTKGCMRKNKFFQRKYITR
jgi:hypothetical protein